MQKLPLPNADVAKKRIQHNWELQFMFIGSLSRLLKHHDSVAAVGRFVKSGVSGLPWQSQDRTVAPLSVQYVGGSTVDDRIQFPARISVPGTA